MKLYLVDLGYDGIESVVFTTAEKAIEYAKLTGAWRVLEVEADNGFGSEVEVWKEQRYQFVTKLGNKMSASLVILSVKIERKK